jgi:hypothetical protein
MHIDRLFRDLSDPSGFTVSRMIYYSRKRELFLTFKPKGQGNNTNRLVVDFNQVDRPKARLSDRDTSESLWLSTNKNSPIQQIRLMSGDTTGNVWILDQEATHKNGAGYISRFQTMWNDLGQPTLDKNAEFLELHFNQTGNWPIQIKVLWDAKLALDTTIQVTDQTGYTLGLWLLGFGTLADASAVSIRRLRLTGGGRRLSLEIAQSTPSHDFSIARAFLSYSPRGERVR